ncbi:DeoR/GlpR family DNA-binding transcription regulator [Ruminococcaceae bacterium OttesenSCG-928-D13]|nr:DeoR/GlpR family DNA-binding transcription regulator [Ruminococcaceae bacterium OttesenSCG-928-D13]
MRSENGHQKRRKSIVGLVNQRGYMMVEDLCAILGVTQATIRSDLDALDALGQLIRLRGVALSIQYSPEERRHAYSGDNRAAIMNHRMSDEKRLIAKVCMGLLKSSDTVFLDTSSTNLALASAMVEATDKAFTVVTNSVDIVHVLKLGSQVNVVATGGDYEAATDSFVGSLAVQALAGFRADYAFITARGFSVRTGIRVYHSQNTPVRKAMLSSAAKRVIVADHSKFTMTGVEMLCGWDQVDILVTDRAPPPEYLPVFEAENIRVMLPDKADLAALETEETL